MTEFNLLYKYSCDGAVLLAGHVSIEAIQTEQSSLLGWEAIFSSLHLVLPTYCLGDPDSASLSGCRAL
jgi:hypothetical protein